MELVFAVPQQHHHPRPNGAVTRPNETPTPLTDLESALNHAAKLLSTSSSSAAAAVASLQNAHQMIGSFLAQLDSRLPAADEDEPMSDRREGEEGDGGEGSRIIDEMEEGMRECVLPSKRRKRQVSPSWSVGRAADQGEELLSVHPMDRRRSSMDLVFQFHA